MERGSTKHGPILDEQMARETPTPSTVPVHPTIGGAPPGMTHDEVEERSRLGRFIPRSSLPGDREELVLGATHLGAPDDILQQLAGLPDGETYQTVNEVWAALGHNNESHRT
jgi:hypothetical protein